MQNLVPPSHFDKDSLDGSPLPLYVNGKKFPTSQASSQHPSPASGKLTLKTPDDFCSPPSHPPPVQRNVFSSNVSLSASVAPTSNFKSKHAGRPILSQPVISQDSGYDWEQNKNNFGSNDNLQLLLQELKKENSQLHELLKQNLTEKAPDSKCNYDVITHQVQFIARLQQDVADGVCKLKDSKALVSKLESNLSEKEYHFRQQNLKLEQLAKELDQEKENTLSIMETVTNLKSNAVSLENENKRLQADHEATLRLLEENHRKEMEKLKENSKAAQNALTLQFEEEKKAIENQVQENIKHLKLEHQSSTAEYQRQWDQKWREVEENKAGSEQRNELLQQKVAQLQKTNSSLDDKLQSLNEQLSNCRNAAEKYEEEISGLTSQVKNCESLNTQLGAYIGQVQADEHSREQWKVEKAEMIAAIGVLNTNKEDLEKTLEMLNVRFHSVSKIQEMQEQAITAHTTAIADPQLQNKASVVTSQWRAKVFELMVQCKSQEIAAREEESKHRLIVKELKTKLEDQTRETEILSNRILDVEAQLELKTHLNQTLESNNVKLKQEIKDCKLKCDQQNLSIEKLHNAVKDVSATYIQAYEDSLSTCMEKCLRMEQRLAFATNRVRTIQDLMQRKESIWRARLQQVLQKKTVGPEKKAHDSPDLRLEVLHLTEERNSLSQQLAHDAAEFEKTIKSMKKSEENHQERNICLEKQLNEYDQQIAELQSTLQALEKRLDDEKYEKDSLVSDLNQVRSANKKDVEEAVEVSKQHHYEEMREQETALNQVKKELTKAVVALRQLERNSVREKNQLMEKLETERQLRSNEEEKLRNNIRTLQKDNNLMLTTLRQEGLLSTIKAARATPIIEKSEDQTPPKRVHFDQSPPSEPESSPPVKTSEMDNMLKDLTNLSEKVLTNSDSED